MDDEDELGNIIDKLIFFKEDMDIMKWEKFELDFSCPELKVNSILIKENIGLINGFYAIFDQNSCVYIGIGRPIWKRVKSHYRAAQGLEKVLRWSEFFRRHAKLLTIYYKDFNYSNNHRLDDKMRLLIQSILEQKYKPSFEFLRRNN